MKTKRKKKLRGKKNKTSIYDSPFWTKDKIAVTSITEDGFWIAINATEYFCPFEVYYWFRNAKHEDIKNVVGNAESLHWEVLDIDLTGESFKRMSKVTRPVGDTNNQ